MVRQRYCPSNILDLKNDRKPRETVGEILQFGNLVASYAQYNVAAVQAQKTMDEKMKDRRFRDFLKVSLNWTCTYTNSVWRKNAKKTVDSLFQTISINQQNIKHNIKLLSLYVLLFLLTW